MDKTCIDSIKTIGSAELHSILENKTQRPPVLIDVRQPEEYERGHIPGSLLMPLGQLEFSHFKIPKNQEIVVYCYSGIRSRTAAMILCSLGYTNVLTLNSGMSDWRYEVIKGEEIAPLAPEEIKTALDVIIVAIKNEITAQQYYLSKSLADYNEDIKKTLKYLADMEGSHIEYLYGKYLALTGEIGEEAKKLEVIQGEAEGFNNVLKGPQAFPPTPEAVIETAVQWEFEAYHFYKTSAEKIKYEEVRTLLYDLAFEERTHASALLKLLAK